MRAEDAVQDLSVRLEHLQQEARSIEEELYGGGRTSHEEPSPESSQRPRRFSRRFRDSAARALEDRFEALEGRLQRLEEGGPGGADTAHPKGYRGTSLGLGDEVVRLQNELDLGLEELREQMAERLHELRPWQETVEQEVRKASAEALQTCNRLADDSLSVSEATQRKMSDLHSWAEQELSVAAVTAAGQFQGQSSEILLPLIAELRAELSQELRELVRSELHKDLASSTLAQDNPRRSEERQPTPRDLSKPGSAGPMPGSSAEGSRCPRPESGASQPPAGIRLGTAQELRTAPPEALDSAGQSEELGGQIWRLGGALRRIVQVLVDLQQQQQPGGTAGARAAAMAADSLAGFSADAMPTHKDPHPLPTRGAEQRHQLILDLYEELHRLEDCVQSRRNEVSVSGGGDCSVTCRKQPCCRDQCSAKAVRQSVMDGHSAARARSRPVGRSASHQALPRR
ncbi:unnamed protein product [Polarella glacialis]|uniref:Uncharacterized protein n=1 Tax=Polarella glacialis TaxID=89957 RepID=A0A813DMQ6_POLGL|nr:unnamed protein product [Polarella glacialis]